MRHLPTQIIDFKVLECWFVNRLKNGYNDLFKSIKQIEKKLVELEQKK